MDLQEILQCILHTLSASLMLYDFHLKDYPLQHYSHVYAAVPLLLSTVQNFQNELINQADKNIIN